MQNQPCFHQPCFFEGTERSAPDDVSRKDVLRHSCDALKIATVPFCNAWPLTHFLPREMPGIELAPWYPSRMRRGLLDGRIDIAMLPVAELLQLPGFGIYGRSCIGARNEVKSVLLISRVPPKRIRTLALDAASRSSVTLAGVLLREFYGNDPQRIPLDLDADPNVCPADAIVIIGDRALALEPGDQWEYRFDMARLWRESTGLPFVFAAWIGRTEWGRRFRGPEIDDDRFRRDIAGRFDRAREEGLRAVDTILDEKLQTGVDGKNPLGISRNVLRNYLTRSLHYHLGEEEQQGLKLFLTLAGKYFCVE